MDRDEAIGALKAHESELRAIGVVSLSLFGSVARGEASAADVDVAVRFGAGFAKPGLDYFRSVDALRQRLSNILGLPVDLVEEPVRKTRFQHEIDRDRAVAF